MHQTLNPLVPTTFNTTPDHLTRRKHLQHLMARETHVHEGLALSMTLRAEELHELERGLKPLDAALGELAYIEVCFVLQEARRVLI